MNGIFNVRANTRQVVAHHYDDQRPGKPLYLLIPGGVIALASLALIVFIAYHIWIGTDLPEASGLPLIAVLAPVYIGGVFLFSYGYELYNLRKALRLTACSVVITVFAVVILAVLFVALGAMGDRESRSSSSGRRVPILLLSAMAGRGRVMAFGRLYRRAGLAGSPRGARGGSRVPTEPPPPQPIECPFCGQTYVPARPTTCPHCGAATPKENCRRARFKMKRCRCDRD
jgi:hypothetical protein